MSDHKVLMSGYMPGEAKNGLKAQGVEDALLGVETPEAIVAVVVIERTARKVGDLTDDITSSLRLSQIEPLTGDNATAALQMLQDTREARTGDSELDFGEHE